MTPTEREEMTLLIRQVVREELDRIQNPPPEWEEVLEGWRRGDWTKYNEFIDKGGVMPAL